MSWVPVVALTRSGRRESGDGLGGGRLHERRLDDLGVDGLAADVEMERGEVLYRDTQGRPTVVDIPLGGGKGGKAAKLRARQLLEELGLGKRTRNVHLKEYSKKSTDHSLESFRPLLDGTTNWPAVMDAFANVGYDSYLTFEYFHPYPHHPEALIYQTSDSLDRLLGIKQG